jgi:hypothetical protein
MLHRTLIAFALVAAPPLLAQSAIAQDSPSAHEGGWPIQGGVKHQPTRGELGGGGEFSKDQAREIDRLYDQLLSSGDKTQPRVKRAR